jgi:uncharacterized membrane protein HdeD (DUF308 family)
MSTASMPGAGVPVKHGWWRWLLVLPGAIVAYILVVIPLAIATDAIDWLPETARNYLSQILHSAFGPWAFVYLGARIAPRHRFITALVLTILQALFLAITLTLGVALGYTKAMRSPMWYLVACGVIGVIASIAASVSFHKEENLKLDR